MNTLSEQTESPQESTLSVLRTFPKAVWMILLGMFINRFGTFVLPFLALHMTGLEFSMKQAGLAMGAYGAGHLVASLLGGHLADTIGRRNTIVTSMFSAAVAMILLSQAASLVAFIVLAGCAGFTAELYRPACSALLTDLVPEKHRVTAFATLRFAINLGWAVGPATAGFLAGRSYVWLFMVDALTSLLFGAVALAGLPQLKRHQRSHWRAMGNVIPDMVEAGRMAFSDRRFVRLVLACFVVGWTFMQWFSTFGLEVKSNGYSEQVYGVLLAWNGVLIVLFEIPLTGWTRKHPSRVMMALGFGLIGVGLLWLVWSKTVVAYAVAMAIFTLGEMISMPITMAYVSTLAPPEMRGRYMGFFGLTWALSIMLGPSLGMVMFSFDPEAFWAFSAVLALLATIIIWPWKTAVSLIRKDVVPQDGS